MASAAESVAAAATAEAGERQQQQFKDHTAFGFAHALQSVKRAKALKEGVHPELLAMIPQTRYSSVQQEAELAKFTAALRSFRPVATVLEAEIAGVKSSHTAGARRVWAASV